MGGVGCFGWLRGCGVVAPGVVMVAWRGVVGGRRGAGVARRRGGRRWPSMRRQLRDRCCAAAPSSPALLSPWRQELRKRVPVPVPATAARSRTTAIGNARTARARHGAAATTPRYANAAGEPDIPASPRRTSLGGQPTTAGRIDPGNQPVSPQDPLPRPPAPPAGPGPASGTSCCCWACWSVAASHPGCQRRPSRARRRVPGRDARRRATLQSSGAERGRTPGHRSDRTDRGRSAALWGL